MPIDCAIKTCFDTDKNKGLLTLVVHYSYAIHFIEPNFLTYNNHQIPVNELQVTRARKHLMDTVIRPKGQFVAEIWRKGKLISKTPININGVSNEGFNLMLNSTFRSDQITPIGSTSWYIGLISNSGYSALAAADTMSSHSGWSEEYSHYSQTNRPAWSMGAASNKQITNSTTVDFSITSDSTIVKGIFVASDNTKGGTSGTLWATGLFSADQTLYNGDTLKITYTVSLS